MKRTIYCILLFMLIAPSVCSQLRIEDCYEKAESNYPLIHTYGLIEKTKEYTLSNAGKGYLPQIQLSAKATYQSDVTKIPVDIPGIKGLSKDQYGVTIDVHQTIWDGGYIRSKKEGAESRAEMEAKDLEVMLYAIRDRVNQLYFGILLQEGLLEQNRMYQNELQRNYDVVKAYIDNGLANVSDLNAVKVEQAQAEQRYEELGYNRKAYLTMLSALIGEELEQAVLLETPVVTFTASSAIMRPELAYFEAGKRHLDAQRKEVNAALMPSFGLFATGGYGKPGLDMLENKFSAYYLAGIRMTWNFSSLYTRGNSLREIDNQKSRLDVQRETFLFNTRLDITGRDSEVQKMRRMIDTDEEIVRLRTSIREAAEVKLSNGTLSVLDLMKEVNAEQMAKQDLIIHKVQLVQAAYQLKYITNN